MDRLRRVLLKLPLAAAAGGSLGRLFAGESGRRRWHLPDGTFANNYGHGRRDDAGFLKIARSLAGGLPPLERFPIAAARPGQFDVAAGMAQITWIGHATFLIQVGGLNILTDPHFSEHVLPMPFFGAARGTPAAFPLALLPEIDVVVISHNHYDHLDAATIELLRARSRRTRYLVPLRLREWFDSDDDVIEYDWWEGGRIAGVRFTAVPAHHWSFRPGLGVNKTLWCSWVIEAAGRRLLFVGDSGYTPDYQDIGSKFAGFDLAVLPIGSYRPRWMMKSSHQDPSEAAQARRDLGARRAVASHWGTFRLSLEPMTEPPQKLAAALAAADEDEDVFWVLQHGETRSWG